AQGADPGGPQRVQAAPGADRPSSDAARLWSRSAAADYGQVGPGGVTATRRDEHRLVHFIELVLDVPRKLDVPGSSTLLGGCSGGYLGGTSTGSSISSSWCSTFPGNATRKLDAPRWYRSVKQSEGHAAPDRALGLLLFPLGCADVLGQGAAGILVLL